MAHFAPQLIVSIQNKLEGITAQSQQLMNASIKAIELKFGTNVTKNPFSATFGSLDGLTVTGAWNAEQARVEF